MKIKKSFFSGLDFKLPWLVSLPPIPPGLMTLPPGASSLRFLRAGDFVAVKVNKTIENILITIFILKLWQKKLICRVAFICSLFHEKLICIFFTHFTFETDLSRPQINIFSSKFQYRSYCCPNFIQVGKGREPKIVFCRVRHKKCWAEGETFLCQTV